MQLIETADPRNGPDDSYVVTYEAVFQPDSADQARLEVWGTADGRVAVGLDTRDRVARRRGMPNWREGFAVGHEPEFISGRGLLALLDIVSNGEIVIRIQMLPLLGLGACKALVRPDVFDALGEIGYTTRHWLGTWDGDACGSRIVPFRAWE